MAQTYGIIGTSFISIDSRGKCELNGNCMGSTEISDLSELDPFRIVDIPQVLLVFSLLGRRRAGYQQIQLKYHESH